MKFLCGNCKAKYQIADEKVSGRTLRMKCRRCGHDILIDGHSMPQSSPPSPAPAPRRPGSSTVSVMPGPGRGGSSAHVMPVARPGTSPGLPRPTSSRSKPPSGLSADFRRHVAAPPEVPQRTAPYDLWHVAIQDVPVGPMTRDELARKIDAGAVTPESLCWREGMDDWRPLGDLPELAQLLRRTREASRPQRGEPARAPRGEPARTQRGRPPPSVPAGPSHHSGSRAAPLPMSLAAADEVQDEDNAEPTRISEFMPPLALVSPHPPAPAPMFAPQPLPQPTASAKVLVPVATAMPSVSVSAPLPSAEAATVQQPAPKSASIFNPGSIAVGLLIGILLVGGPMLYRNTWGSQPAPPVEAAPQAKVEAPRPAPAVAAVDPTLKVPDEGREEVKPAAPTRSTNRATAQAPKPVKPDSVEKPVGRQLSDAEKKKLLDMAGAGVIGTDPDLTKLGARGELGGAGGATQPSLTPQQLNKVVQDNKSALQRCYESALRAAGGRSESTIKISVNVVVGGSGIAKSVLTAGDGLGNMTDCIKSAVKRWHFPQAAGESEFAFPLVFQPGA